MLNPSVTPPFQIDDDNLSETTRLTHRVLDLRRPYMQNNLMLRYKTWPWRCASSWTRRASSISKPPC